MPDRASRYARIQRTKSGKKLEREALILAHAYRTPKGKLRLKSVGIAIGKGEEKIVTGALGETDPRYAFETDFGLRKEVHNLVRRSAQFSKYYNCVVKMVYGI